jgi:TonB family protein
MASPGRKTRDRVGLRLAALVRITWLLVACSWAATLAAQEHPRKVVVSRPPNYPELAKKMHLVGKVKLEVIITPDGSVTSAKMLGGNPVFQKSAISAVMQWKFEPAKKESTAVVMLDFADQ